MMQCASSFGYGLLNPILNREQDIKKLQFRGSKMSAKLKNVIFLIMLVYSLATFAGPKGTLDKESFFVGMLSSNFPKPEEKVVLNIVSSSKYPFVVNTSLATKFG